MSPIDPRPSVQGHTPHFVIRPGSSRSRQTFAFSAKLTGSSEHYDHSLFERAVNVVLAWFAQKFPDELPEEAGQLKSFEIDQFGQQVIQCVSLPQRRLWSARLVQPDAPYNDRPAVAGRSWITEVVLSHGNEGTHFGVRVQCVSTSYSAESIAFTRPRVVVDMARTVGLMERLPITGEPWILCSEEDVDQLYRAVTDPDRQLPVVVLTAPNPQQAGAAPRDFLLDETNLARRLLGIAHVVCMPSSLGYHWTERVGKVWSVFHGAVRTYGPGLDFDQDSPYEHKRVLADKIRFWRQGDDYGVPPFTSFLVEKLFEDAASRTAGPLPLDFYPRARTLQATEQRLRLLRGSELEAKAEQAEESIQSLKDRIGQLAAVHDEELEALVLQMNELQTECDTALELGQEAANNASKLREANLNLHSQNESLRFALNSRGHLDEVDKIPTEALYEDLPEWVAERLTGRLVLLPRALSAIRKAQYEDVELVYNCLLVLARHYRDMKLGHEGAREDWDDSLRKLSVSCSPTISKERAGEEGDTYFVRYPQSSGQKALLDTHLKKGTSREERYCFRLYFFWDSMEQQVVVGWLPSHLDTRAS